MAQRVSKLHTSTDVSWRQRAALSVTHAAEILSLSRKNTYTLIERGHIRAVRLGKRLVVPVTEIDRLLETPRPRRAPATSTRENITA